jgi:hypothetical protein
MLEGSEATLVPKTYAFFSFVNAPEEKRGVTFENRNVPE